MDLLVNFTAITEGRQAMVAVLSATPRIHAPSALSNHSITADLTNWIVTLFTAQSNYSATVTEVFLCVVAPTYTTSSVAATDFRHHVLGTTKALCGVIRR